MKAQATVRITAALLCACAAGCSGAPEQSSADIRRLEMRVTALEGVEMQASPRPERNRLLTGPAALRVASMRAAADFLERAELARRSGDNGRAAALFQSAVDEVGSDALADVEPLFKNRTAVQETAQKPAATPETPAAPPAAGAAATPAAPEPPAPAKAAPPHARDRDRASINGAVRLEGPFASEGGMGVVLLAPVGGGRSARAIHAQVEQRNKEFVPHLLTIPVGSTVSFPNADPVFHNVFSLSATKRFDLGLFKQGSKDVTFNKAGVVHVLCNLHAAMSSYVIVHEEPYAALTDRAGRFHFRDLPPGRYRVRVWHERARDMTTREVTLEAGATELSVPVRADTGRDLGTDKEGKPRGPQKHS
jgi:plastocyanin